MLDINLMGLSVWFDIMRGEQFINRSINTTLGIQRAYTKLCDTTARRTLVTISFSFYRPIGTFPQWMHNSSSACRAKKYNVFESINLSERYSWQKYHQYASRFYEIIHDACPQINYSVGCDHKAILVTYCPFLTLIIILAFIHRDDNYTSILWHRAGERYKSLHVKII